MESESKLDPSIMEQNVKYDNINPWIASSIFEFYYFCCPECDEKSKDKQDFVNHAAYHVGVSSLNDYNGAQSKPPFYQFMM